jgi:hypothetical protein
MNDSSQPEWHDAPDWQAQSAERTVALRKLLESKDAAVRASIPAA